MPEPFALTPVGPIDLVQLFPPLHRELMTLLRGLDAAAWQKPTTCALWSVKDIVAHLLDTCVRKLSLARDALVLSPDRTITSYSDLVAYLNHLNAEWVDAMRRVSPRILMDLLDWAEPQLHAYVAALEPNAPARFSVAWAGEETSPNWFDTGREYTERWIHQQQIREAVGAPGLTARSWLYPALDIFVRALPFTYRDVPAPPGTRIRLEIQGEAGGVWTLARVGEEWVLFTGDVPRPAAAVTLDQDTAWRLFTKSLSAERGRRDIRVEGDAALGRPVLGALAIMA